MLSINIEKREAGKKGIYQARSAGKIPAVFYGPKESSTPISVNEIDFIKLYRTAGESSVVHLKDGSRDHEALIHDVIVDPVSEKILHADFYIIEKGKKVTVSVPIEFIGVSPAVKNGALLVKVLHEVEIEAKPADLPHSVSVDISALVDTNVQITAKDIVMPEGVTLITKDNEVVALASVAKEEVEEVSTPIDFSQIEVEKKGKKEEEGEASAEEK